MDNISPDVYRDDDNRYGLFPPPGRMVMLLSVQRDRIRELENEIEKLKGK